MATTFNLNAVAAQTSGGYSRASRAALTGEALVKVKDSAVKKVLKPPLTANVQVSSFDPSQMTDKSNFFNFVGSWRSNSQILRQHVESYYMQNVFVLSEVRTRQATAADGTLRVDNNNDPIMEDYVHQGESLFDVWHNVSTATVVESVRIYAEHAEDVDRQNLQWSWEFILNNIDPDLRHYLLSYVESFASHVGPTGPIAFFAVAQRIVTSTNNLAHNVISGVMVLGLQHFQGEDVTECIFVLRNVLKFLNHGHANFDRTPPTIMDYLVEVFLRASNVQFVQYVQNLSDFHQSDIDTPEKLFEKVSEYYNKLITSQGKVWLPVRKKRSAFTGSTPPAKDDTCVEIKEGSGTPPPAPAQSGDPPSNPRSNNRRFQVDRTPPAEGEPHVRKNSRGFDEHWCARCPKGGRWGNHPTEGHDEWWDSYKKKHHSRQNQDRSGNSSRASARSDDESIASSRGQAPGPMGSVSVSRANPSSFLRRTLVSWYDSDSE